MRWAWIDDTDGTWDNVERDGEDAPEGFSAYEIPAGYYTGAALWSSAGRGWKDVVVATPLISIAGFMLLFTASERHAIRAARATDAATDDFWELLLACTSGVSLTHPVVISGVTHLVNATLITSARATDILAGTPPA